MSRKHRVKARRLRSEKREKERKLLPDYFNKIDSSKNRAECRALVAKFKEHGCVSCSENDSCCLDAHHRNPEDKRFNIGEAIRLKLSPEVVKQELAKCECVCANCHRKLNAGRAISFRINIKHEEYDGHNDCT